MNPETTMWFSVFCSICVLRSYYCLDYNHAKLVTYGEPCVSTRRFPFQIEGPKPPPKEEKIPVSLNFKIVSDMYVQPRRTEYPISLDIPCTTSAPSEKLLIDDTSRGKVYAYNTYVPYIVNSAPSLKNYNFAIDIPSTTKDSTTESETKRIERLKGLKSRIDRVLVPACDVPSRSSYCQC